MKRRLPYSILIAFFALFCGAGWYWWNYLRHIETTDNAYIRGEITPISAKISGYVEQVLVSDNQIVAAGDPLVRIQDLEFKIRLERGRNGITERQAALLVVAGKRNQQQSMIELAKAQLAVVVADLEKEYEEFKRFERLYAKNIISPHEYETALAKKKKWSAEKSGAVASLRIAQQGLEILLAEQKRIKAEIGQNLEELKLLQKQVDDTLICAPISGTVGNRRVRMGQYVRPGSILMALIPLNDVWIEANFKEVQLAGIMKEQPVTITVDAFPDHLFNGRIQSLAPASGAVFSILPPENASGNFTKIVQRIPVKITFDKDRNFHRKLLPGMSVKVSVDTRFVAKQSTKENKVADILDK